MLIPIDPTEVIDPAAFFELLAHIKSQSANFKEGRLKEEQQAHLFIRIHAWIDGRGSNFTIVDMAGYSVNILFYGIRGKGRRCLRNSELTRAFPTSTTW